MSLATSSPFTGFGVSTNGRVMDPYHATAALMSGLVAGYLVAPPRRPSTSR